MVAEDPVHEVLAMTQNIASLVGQISKNIPDLVNDAMLASAEDIEQRVVLAVRQNSKVVDRKSDRYPQIEISRAN